MIACWNEWPSYQNMTFRVTIVMVANQPSWFSDTYRRYLLSVLRDQLSIGEVPIKLYLQQRSRDDERDELGSDEQRAHPATAEE